MFGFGFNGDLRSPFDVVVETVAKCEVPLLSVDVPSGWEVDAPGGGARRLRPACLVSLTAPKICSQEFVGLHFLGGRFVPRSLQRVYELEELCSGYEGTRSICRLS
eukprot:Polyplicarium_translucidae@DN5484_c0_g1_i1.p2